LICLVEIGGQIRTTETPAVKPPSIVESGESAPAAEPFRVNGYAIGSEVAR
jgi:hypothetical protein